MARAAALPSPEHLRWVTRQVHPRARVTAVVPLLGGITAAMDRITVATPDGARDVVLRRWPDAPWTDGLVAREAAALDAVRGHDVPAPRLVATDGDGAATGVRCSLVTALDGEPDLSPADPPSWLGRLAGTHAGVHAVPAHLAVRWDGWYRDDAPLDWLPDRGVREAARAAAAGPLGEETVLVHGDYQHFNVLWRAGRLTGVVDWPNAATGRRGTDVGHCRLNLAVLFDAATAADYLTAYERAAGVVVDRRADLRALLCFDRDWQRFIPRQVAGRTAVDVAGMPARVAAVVRDAVDAVETR